MGHFWRVVRMLLGLASFIFLEAATAGVPEAHTRHWPVLLYFIFIIPVWLVPMACYAGESYMSKGKHAKIRTMEIWSLIPLAIVLLLSNIGLFYVLSWRVDCINFFCHLLTLSLALSFMNVIMHVTSFIAMVAGTE